MGTDNYLAALDDFSLTAGEIVDATCWKDEIKMVHNLTDRGIIAFRKGVGTKARGRLYSLASLIAFDTIMRVRASGVALVEGSKIADAVLDRAKVRFDDLYANISEVRAWNWLAYAFDRSHEPPILLSYVVPRTETIESLQITLTSGWPSDVSNLFQVDRVIWECAQSWSRAKNKKTNDH